MKRFVIIFISCISLITNLFSQNSSPVYFRGVPVYFDSLEVQYVRRILPNFTDYFDSLANVNKLDSLIQDYSQYINYPRPESMSKEEYNGHIQYSFIVRELLFEYFRNEFIIEDAYPIEYNMFQDSDSNSTQSFSKSFVDKLRLYERDSSQLTITDTNQIEWDWDCSIPDDIQKSLLSLSCVPNVWHYSSEYSYYCCFNLNVVFVNPKVIMAVFYTNANTDFTRSLIIATFDTLGNEISSHIIATDDNNIVRPLQSNGKEYRIVRTIVEIKDNNINVTEISLFFGQYDDTYRREEITHNYSIENGGTILFQ